MKVHGFVDKTCSNENFVIKPYIPINIEFKQIRFSSVVNEFVNNWLQKRKFVMEVHGFVDKTCSNENFVVKSHMLINIEFKLASGSSVFNEFVNKSSQKWMFVMKVHGFVNKTCSNENFVIKLYMLVNIEFKLASISLVFNKFVNKWLHKTKVCNGSTWFCWQNMFKRKLCDQTIYVDQH